MSVTPAAPPGATRLSVAPAATSSVDRMTRSARAWRSRRARERARPIPARSSDPTAGERVVESLRERGGQDDRRPEASQAGGDRQVEVGLVLVLGVLARYSIRRPQDAPVPPAGRCRSRRRPDRARAPGPRTTRPPRPRRQRPVRRRAAAGRRRSRPRLRRGRRADDECAAHRVGTARSSPGRTAAVASGAHERATAPCTTAL